VGIVLKSAQQGVFSTTNGVARKKKENKLAERFQLARKLDQLDEFSRGELTQVHMVKCVQTGQSHVRNARSPLANAARVLNRADSESSHPAESTSNQDIDALKDSIRTEYHPCSGQGTIMQSFDEYSSDVASENFCVLPEREPWWPFRSRIDFEAAELALNCTMNAEQTNKFIDLPRRVGLELNNFTIASHAEMQKTWELAAEKSTK
ncbi:hypothetical protein V5O48_019182, partial [Marasmius crinis-equi]